MIRRIIIAIALVSAFLNPRSLFSQSSVKGVWKGVEFHFQSPDTAFVWKDIQPCLYLLTERHYSLVYVQGTKPREPLPEGTSRSNISNDQLRAIMTTFHANSGTYEVNDTAFILQPVVSLMPSAMQGRKNTIYYKLEKDVLWLLWKNSSATSKLKLSRLE